VSVFGKAPSRDEFAALLARVEKIERLCPGLVGEREFADEQRREKERQEAHARAVVDFLARHPAPDLVRVVAVRYFSAHAVATDGTVCDASIGFGSSRQKKWQAIETVAGGHSIHKADCARIAGDPQFRAGLAAGTIRIQSVSPHEAQSIHLRDRRDAPRLS
jgi:hypothetical protein